MGERRRGIASTFDTFSSARQLVQGMVEGQLRNFLTTEVCRRGREEGGRGAVEKRRRGENTYTIGVLHHMKSGRSKGWEGSREERD